MSISPAASPRDHRPSAAKRRVVRREVPEPAAALVGEELVPFHVDLEERLPRLAGPADELDAPVHLRQVEVAVLVEVAEERAEAGAAPARGGEAREGRAVGKLPRRILRVEDVQLIGEVGDVEVEEAVAVGIAEGDAHVGGRLPHGVISHAAHHRLLLESAVLLVDPQVVRLAVVGDEEVGPVIAVQVGGDDPQPGPGKPPQPGRDGHIEKARRPGPRRAGGTGPRL